MIKMDVIGSLVRIDKASLISIGDIVAVNFISDFQSKITMRNGQQLNVNSGFDSIMTAVGVGGFKHLSVIGSFAGRLALDQTQISSVSHKSDICEVMLQSGSVVAVTCSMDLFVMFLKAFKDYSKTSLLVLEAS